VQHFCITFSVLLLLPACLFFSVMLCILLSVCIQWYIESQLAARLGKKVMDHVQTLPHYQSTLCLLLICLPVLSCFVSCLCIQRYIESQLAARLGKKVDEGLQRLSRQQQEELELYKMPEGLQVGVT
jgi:hypothetical protein